MHDATFEKINFIVITFRSAKGLFIRTLSSSYTENWEPRKNTA